VLGYGRDGTVSGLLQTVDGNPIAGETVDVSQQAPGWAPHRQRAVTTGADGRFTYTLTPGPSRTLTFAFPGNATLRPSSASTIIQVAGSARIQLEHQALAGHTLRITGQVLGGYIPTGGVLVQLQYRVRGVPVGWAPFHRAIHTDSHGRFALQFPLSRAARGYTYMFNAVIEQQNGWPYLTTTTNAVARNVR
jgi:hypothetical protein